MDVRAVDDHPDAIAIADRLAALLPRGGPAAKINEPVVARSEKTEVRIASGQIWLFVAVATLFGVWHLGADDASSPAGCTKTIGCH